MRKFLVMLLPASLALTPDIAAAAYKCVVNGMTTYSQDSCGEDAKQVDTAGALAGVGVATPVPPATRAAPPAASPDKPATQPAPRWGRGWGEKRLPGDTGGDNSCAARLKAYQASMACFGFYRHGHQVLHPAAYAEAFSHCKEVAEPTDCD